MVELVWFKKDLRHHDHAPLFEARRRGPVVGLFVVEPEWLQSQEFAPRHLQFAQESLLELKISLEKLNIPLLVLKGSLPGVFHELKNHLEFSRLYSHEETGSLWTYKRDQEVGLWCGQQGVEWKEFAQFAVVRPLASRDHWNRMRTRLIDRPLHPLPVVQDELPLTQELLQKSLHPQALVEKPESLCVRGGRKRAEAQLLEFLSDRAGDYRKDMSSPLYAYDSCSLLSAHITWGTMSLSEIHHRLQEWKRHQRAAAPSEESRSLWAGVKAFESRLWWHCHFIQKLEDAPDLEKLCMNPAFEQLRSQGSNLAFLQAWQAGETGYPFIDACMRALQKNGWINFRMRAMLMSFASYQLWLDWRLAAPHLARLFVDFEPGIHYSQAQMQSGVTGINAIRIYSPIKQSKDQDPEGEFIARYCPELSELDPASRHWPQDLPPLLATSFRGKYPEPIVDPVISYQSAKEKIYSFRKRPEVRKASQQVYLKHGSRKNSFFPKQSRGLTREGAPRSRNKTDRYPQEP